MEDTAAARTALAAAAARYLAAAGTSADAALWARLMRAGTAGHDDAHRARSDAEEELAEAEADMIGAARSLDAAIPFALAHGERLIVVGLCEHCGKAAVHVVESGGTIDTADAPAVAL